MNESALAANQVLSCLMMAEGWYRQCVSKALIHKTKAGNKEEVRSFREMDFHSHHASAL